MHIDIHCRSQNKSFNLQFIIIIIIIIIVIITIITMNN